MSPLHVAIVIVWAAVHALAGHLRFLDGIPRSRWLSLAGGISIAYVFVHLLPELAASNETLRQHAGLIEHPSWTIALAGLVAFYGLERWIKRRRPVRAGREDHSGESPVGAGAFWLHVGSFALYNALIGYLMDHREETGSGPTVLFGIAMALHFLVNDFGLRQTHARYDRLGRWLLVAAIVCGYLLGVGLDGGELTTRVLLGFLAGGVVMNVLKEELPDERRSRFLPFAVGAAGYAALLFTVG